MDFYLVKIGQFQDDPKTIFDESFIEKWPFTKKKH